MSMSKKDYEVIASALKATGDRIRNKYDVRGGNYELEIGAFEQTVTAIGEALRINYKGPYAFNSSKFYAASGIERG